MDAVPAAIEGLRAGQTGVVVLGRVIMGDIAVTLVELIQSGFLTVEETTDPGDWQLTLVTATPTSQRQRTLLDYEKRLLDGLSADGESRVSSLAARFGKRPGRNPEGPDPRRSASGLAPASPSRPANC